MLESNSRIKVPFDDSNEYKIIKDQVEFLERLLYTKTCYDILNSIGSTNNSLQRSYTLQDSYFENQRYLNSMITLPDSEYVKKNRQLFDVFLDTSSDKVFQQVDLDLLDVESLVKENFFQKRIYSLYHHNSILSQYPSLFSDGLSDLEELIDNIKMDISSGILSAPNINLSINIFNTEPLDFLYTLSFVDYHISNIRDITTATEKLLKTKIVSMYNLDDIQTFCILLLKRTSNPNLSKLYSLLSDYNNFETYTIDGQFNCNGLIEILSAFDANIVQLKRMSGGYKTLSLGESVTTSQSHPTKSSDEEELENFTSTLPLALKNALFNYSMGLDENIELHKSILDSITNIVNWT